MGSEFRALRAESRNIDFGDLTDRRQFQQATTEVNRYIDSLKQLEAQIDATTPQGRQLKAQVVGAQRIAGDRVSLQAQQRAAAIASQNAGTAGAIAAGSTVVAAPLVGVGRESVTTLIAFDDRMSQLQAVTRATASETERLRQRAKELGATTRFSASQTAEAMGFLGMAGFQTNEIMDSIEPTLQLASAGNLDLARSADIASNVLGGFRLQNGELTRVVDVLALQASRSNTSVEQLGLAMSYAAPAARAYGADVETTAAMIGALGDAGIQGEKAGTTLRAMFTKLAAPTGAAAGRLDSLGVAVKGADGQLRSMPDVLGDLNGALAGLDEQQRIAAIRDIFGLETLSGAQVLLANVDKLNSSITANARATGAAGKMAATMENNLGGALRSLQSAAEGVRIEIGEALAPVIRGLAVVTTAALATFTRLPKPIRSGIVMLGAMVAVVAVLTGVVAAAAVAFFSLKSSMLAAGVGGTALKSGLSPLTGFFQTAMTGFAASGFSGMMASISAGFAGIGGSIGGAAAAVGAFITGPIGLIVAGAIAIIGLLEVLTPQFNVLGRIIGGTFAPLALVFGILRGLVQGLVDAFRPLIASLDLAGGSGNYLRSTFAEAGKILGRFARIGTWVGKHLGKALGRSIVLPLMMIIRVVKGAIATFRLLGTIAGFIINIITSPFRLLWRTMTAIKDATAPVRQAILGAIAMPFQAIAGIFNRVREAIAGIRQSLVNLIPEPVLKLINWLGSQPVVGNLFGGGNLQKGAPVKMATGGLVQGPGTSVGDRIPAMLSNGEFVVNARVAQSNLGFLHALNQGIPAEQAIKLIPTTQGNRPTGTVNPIPPPSIPSELAMTAAATPNDTGSDVHVHITNHYTIQMSPQATGDPQQAANELIAAIEPQFQQMVKDSLADLLDKTRG